MLAPMLPITQWFDRNDPTFAGPMNALHAGYTYGELLGEYQRVFTAESALKLFLADYRAFMNRNHAK